MLTCRVNNFRATSTNKDIKQQRYSQRLRQVAPLLNSGQIELPRGSKNPSFEYAIYPLSSPGSKQDTWDTVSLKFTDPAGNDWKLSCEQTSSTLPGQTVQQFWSNAYGGMSALVSHLRQSFQ